jgi:AAA family ATP:ADP antiporter
MADIYTKQQSRRLFGVITAGGSAGALVGPLLTSVLVVPIGFKNLLPISALLLVLAVYCVFRLRAWVRHGAGGTGMSASADSEKALGGKAWAGLNFVVSQRYFSAIALALLCANFLGGAMYMYLAQMVSVTFEGSDRQTQIFAFMDAAINALSFIGQLLIVKHSVKKLGIGWTLSFLPILSIVGFAILAFNPTFAIIAGFQILRRSLGFGFSKPTSDMLYSVVSPEAKYKAKNFIDTTVYRGWDVVSTWTIRSIGSIGLSGIALLCVPVAVVWMLIVRWVGREYQRRDTEVTPAETG